MEMTGTARKLLGTEMRWNVRRKKTLIMKGLENPTQETVIRSLVQYGIATGKEVVRVTVRQVKGVKHKDWAFVLMTSEQAVEDSFRKRFHLKGTPLYIQKDLSWETEGATGERSSSRPSVPISTAAFYPRPTE